MTPLAREWVEKAEGDFLVAVQIMRRKKQRVYDAACFHCQQAVEKYLKARLTEAGQPCPRTHDLPTLLASISVTLAIAPRWPRQKQL
ncbi:MAG TPA: HEPN domain-containing protein [Verrucomicrobiae bacterium]|jgi:HEPN domain-containing protein